MHTGSQLTGTVCRCMSCATDRQLVISREARRRYRSEYNSIQQAADDAEVALEKAQTNLERVKGLEWSLFSRVREELNAEQS